ncbi:hypothetical protein [Rhizorhabdus sp. FW153]|jgi:hypothetical protein|uniref:hypothetical protein n=1 Tax=Rhizorhabdus sp. FW153 TaxID=3400216 RepID=UPI003CF6A271
MSDRFVRYMEREHARLNAMIADHRSRHRPDSEIARLKRVRSMMRYQIGAWRADTGGIA